MLLMSLKDSKLRSTDPSMFIPPNLYLSLSLIDNKIYANPIRHQNSHQLYDIRSSHLFKTPLRLAGRGIKIYRSNMFCGLMER
jgi:hypothetical protein